MAFAYSNITEIRGRGMAEDRTEYNTTPKGFTKVGNGWFPLLQKMPAAEMKVTLALIRLLDGWGKTEDRISLSQIMAETGLSKQGVLNGVKSGLARGTITRHACGQYYVYALQLVNEVDQSTELTSQRSRPVFTKTSQRSRLALVNEVDQFSPKLVNEVDTPKKEFKEIYKDNNIKKEELNIVVEKPELSDVQKAVATYVTESGDTGRMNTIKVEELVTDYTLDWFLAAYKIMRERGQNPRNLKYVEGILRRCKDEGHAPNATRVLAAPATRYRSLKDLPKQSPNGGAIIVTEC